MSEEESNNFRTKNYISNAFQRHNKELRSITNPSKTPDTFLGIVPDDVVELYEDFTKLKDSDSEYKQKLLEYLTPSSIDLIVKSDTKETIEEPQENTKETIEENIKKTITETESQIQSQEQDGFLNVPSQQKENIQKFYPSTIASTLAFKDFQTNHKRINILKLLFNGINPFRKQKLEEKDKNRNTPFHLLIKGFSEYSKNATSPASSTEPMTTSSEDLPVEKTNPPRYLDMLTELRDTIRIMIEKPKVQYTPPETQSTTMDSELSSPTSMTLEDPTIHIAQQIADVLHKTTEKQSIDVANILSEKNDNGETAIDLFVKHDYTTPFNTKERNTNGFTIEEPSQDKNQQQTSEEESQIDIISNEIKNLLNPYYYSSEIKPEQQQTIEFNKKGLLNLKYYYIYGKTSDYENESTIVNNAKVIELNYHSFIKVNKRLHSIMDKIHYDLTNNTNTHIPSPINKDHYALAFYYSPDVEDSVRLDLFFYNSFSYYDIFGLDELLNNIL